MYDNGDKHIGWHSDYLSDLGPLPIVASVSLGASRTFRLKTSDPDEEPVVYSMQLPHNSLLIMWPPTQEQWRHGVPKERHFPYHEDVGAVRVNLTFRQIRPEIAAVAPVCDCGVKAHLKCVFKGTNRGKYIFVCGHAGVNIDHREVGEASKSCDMIKWFDEEEYRRKLVEQQDDAQ